MILRPFEVVHLLQACMHFSTGLGAHKASHLAAVSTKHFRRLVKDADLQLATAKLFETVLLTRTHQLY